MRIKEKRGEAGVGPTEGKGQGRLQLQGEGMIEVLEKTVKEKLAGKNKLKEKK